MEQTDILRGERVRLTAMRTDDAATLARWWEQGAFMRQYDSTPAVPKTEAQIAKDIEDHQAKTALSNSPSVAMMTTRCSASLSLTASPGHTGRPSSAS